MRRVWPYLVLAGCYSDRALEIIVHDPDGLGVTHVELYVGRMTTEQAEKLPKTSGIRPELGTFDTTVWWSRLDDPKDLEPMGPDGAKYQILPSDAGNAIASLIAVGFHEESGGRTPLGVVTVLDKLKIPEDGRNEYNLDLAAFDPIGRASGKPGLRLWGGDSKQACVQVDSVPLLEMYGTKSAMVVREGDIDCDSYGDTDALECFADRYLAQTAIPRKSLSCAFTRPFGIDTTAAGCVVGGATCADGTGSRPGVCSPTAYCAPTAACSTCTAAQPCDPHGTRQGAPYIECTVYYDDPNGQAEFCEFVPALLELEELFPTYQLQCDLMLDAKLRKATADTWEDHVNIGNSAAVLIAPATSPRGDHSCDFDIKVKGSVPINSQNTGPIAEFGVTLTVPFTQPSSGRGLMMPVVLRIGTATNGCDLAAPTASCRIMPTTFDDPVLEGCLRAPALPDTVVGD